MDNIELELLLLLDESFLILDSFRLLGEVILMLDLLLHGLMCLLH